MPWANTDREKIRVWLEVPNTDYANDILDTNMGAATADTIATVQASIAKITVWEDQQEEQEAADERALIKADVLEYDPNFRGVGLSNLIGKHKRRIEVALNLENIRKPQNLGYTQLYRS